MQKKHILTHTLILLAFFTGQINSIVKPTSESHLARLLLNKHAGLLPSSFSSEQMIALLQDVKKESYTHGLDEALTIRQMSYLIEEKLNYWQQIRNDSTVDYNIGRFLLLTAAFSATLTCLYIVHAQQNYADKQAQVELLSANASKDLESIKHELRTLGAPFIDLNNHFVLAYGPRHKSTEINGLLTKAKLILDNLNSAKWTLKNADFSGWFGGCITVMAGMQGTLHLLTAYYSKFYHQKYSFIRQELQKILTNNEDLTI